MKAAVVIISDGCYHEKREDTSGKILRQILAENKWDIPENRIVPDNIPKIQKQILELSEQKYVLIVTTGGTGLGPHDVTPEAIGPLLDREVPGLGELMRFRGIQVTDFAALSRSLAGVRNQTLILSLPGSPKGASESLIAVIKVLPHAVDLLHGRTHHS